MKVTPTRYNRNDIINAINKNKSYKADITPSPNFLLVTQDTGYKPYQALNDIIDNSLDADATKVDIVIGQQKSKPFITISDNGYGMDVDILAGAMVLGASSEELNSKNKKCEDGSQGRFGTGLKTSIATFQSKSTIFSKIKDGELYKVEYNIEEMVNNGGYNVPISLATDDEVDFFNEHTNNSQSGTVIKICDIEKFNCTSITSQKATMISSIGQTFRRFIYSKKCSFTINGKIVYGTDPMSFMIPLADGKLTYKSTLVNTLELDDLLYTDSDGNQKKDGSAKLSIYKLPDTDKNLSMQSGFGSITKSGFYVLRNNREIMEADTLGLFSRNTELSKFRVEMDVTSDIDSITLPNFLKTRLFFSDYFLDRIRPFIKSEVNRFRAEYKKANPSKKLSKQQENYNDLFINHMKRIKGLLPTLPSLEPEKKKTKPTNSTGRKNKSYNPTDNIIIGYNSMGEFGKAWEGYLLDDSTRKVELIINEDHKLNTDFMVDGEPKLLGVVTSIMASFAYSKYCNIPDGKESDDYLEKWEQIEAQFGNVLRQILDGVPQ